MNNVRSDKLEHLHPLHSRCVHAEDFVKPQAGCRESPQPGGDKKRYDGAQER